MLLQFDRCHVGVQLSDLYDFMRKVMEKWDWNPRIGLQMLSWYDGVVPLSDDEREYVRLRLSYPEKFWKITNHYYNSRKSWIPDRTKEKLDILIRQEKKKEDFLRRMD